jgi:hypothetical protein
MSAKKKSTKGGQTAAQNKGKGTGERLTFASPLPPDREAVIKGEIALTSQ